MEKQKLFKKMEDNTNESFIDAWKEKYLDQMDITSYQYHVLMKMSVDDFVEELSFESFSEGMEKEINDTLQLFKTK